MLILEYGPTKTLTGHVYLQKLRSSHISDIKVGTSNNINTVRPETTGVATRVVEKVARSIKKNSRGQSLLNHFGHLRKSPEILLLYSLVLPFIGEKKDFR